MGEEIRAQETTKQMPEDFVPLSAIEPQWRALAAGETLPDLFEVINEKGKPVVKNVTDEQGMITRSRVLCVFKKTADGTLLAGSAVGNSAGPTGVEAYTDAEFVAALAALGGTGFVRIVEGKVPADPAPSLNARLQDLLDIAHSRLEVAGLGHRLDAAMIRQLREEAGSKQLEVPSAETKPPHSQKSEVPTESASTTPITRPETLANITKAETPTVSQHPRSPHWVTDPHARALVAALLRGGSTYGIAAEALEDLGYQTASGNNLRSALIGSANRHFNGDPLKFAASLEADIDPAAKDAVVKQASEIISQARIRKVRKPITEAQRAARSTSMRRYQATRKLTGTGKPEKNSLPSTAVRAQRRALEDTVSNKLWDAVFDEGARYANDPHYKDEVEHRFSVIVARLKEGSHVITPPFVFITTEGVRTPAYTDLPAEALGTLDAHLLNTAIVRIEIASHNGLKSGDPKSLKRLQKALAYKVAEGLKALKRGEPSPFKEILTKEIQRIQLVVQENLPKGAVFSKQFEYPGRVAWPGK